MSDHLDSPEVRADPRLDISDTYVFKGRTGTVFIMCTNPLSGGGGFWTDHHGRDASRPLQLQDLPYRNRYRRFDVPGHLGPLVLGRQTMTLTMLTGADAGNEDACGQIVAEGVTGTEALSTRGIRAFAGSCGDPFFTEPNVVGAVATAVTTGTKLDLYRSTRAHPVNVFAEHQRAERSSSRSRTLSPAPERSRSGAEDTDPHRRRRMAPDRPRRHTPLMSSLFGFSFPQTSTTPARPAATRRLRRDGEGAADVHSGRGQRHL